MDDTLPSGPEPAQQIASPETTALYSRRDRPVQSAALRRRMRRQAQLMIFVALLVLGSALSVPFLLRYLNIKIP